MNLNRPPAENKNFGKIRLLIFVLVSFLMSDFCITVFWEGNYKKEIICGWALAVIFNITGLIIKRTSINKEIHHFFFWALGINTANLIAFFIAAYLLFRKAALAIRPFILSLFIAYFVMLIYDILTIRSSASRQSNKNLA